MCEILQLPEVTISLETLVLKVDYYRFEDFLPLYNLLASFPQLPFRLEYRNHRSTTLGPSDTDDFDTNLPYFKREFALLRKWASGRAYTPDTSVQFGFTVLGGYIRGDLRTGIITDRTPGRAQPHSRR